MAGFGETKAVFLTEFVEIQFGQGRDAAVPRDQLTSNFNSTGSFGPGAQEDREQLLVGESPRTQICHFFPRALLVGEVMDTGILGHFLKRASIFRWDVASYL